MKGAHRRSKGEERQRTMTHNHHEAHDHHGHFIRRRDEGRRRLLICVVVTLVMMVFEFVAGILTGSLALVSDAGHMLTHGFSLIVSYAAILITRRPATDRRTFGLYRAEILAALLNGATLLLITIGIVWYAYKRFLHPVPISGGWMLVVAVIGLAVNILTALILRESVEGNINIRSAFLHMIGDMVSSVVVVAGAIIILWTGWYPIDPILSVMVCALILVWAYSLTRESVEILLQATPRHLDIQSIKKRLSGVEGVRRVHDVHVWTITSGLYSMSAHVLVDDILLSASCAILDAIGAILRDEFHITHYTIQLECGVCERHPVTH
ncbi:MAG: cation diffusion facilitator family transporter [Candidatus Aureabacteria bacterium]|nr:cation diffusion facilitator family transporter [Candidatus Auribacterota bacterium]